ncbi:MAG: tetratricopeptide repeat protein [Coriobacteriia bacterium]
MDETRFQEAQQAYNAGDYRTAAKAFLASAGRGADGNGAAYHMAGNSLLRLRRYADAVTVFKHALRDELYERRGAVHANLGVAFMALGDYSEAVRSYESALGEADYPTPYKAYQGMASALLERGRVEEAAAAYRKAALDGSNPDPGKALVNLGLCFMALGRPADAVDAYQAALGFDDYRGRGKALANLGQAYHALGQYPDAVRTFERATQLHSHELSPAAAAAYEDARAKLRAQPRPVGEAALAPEAALDAGEEQPTQSFETQARDASDLLGFGDDEAVADFFSVTDEELRRRDIEERRARRTQKTPVRRRAVITTIVIVVVLICVAAVLAWFTGFGWPTQQQTVSGMLTAYEDGGAVDSYWVAVPAADVTKEMAKIPTPKDFSVSEVSRGSQTSTVTVIITPESGSDLRYAVTLVREGVGWKVNGIDNDWQSAR